MSSTPDGLFASLRGFATTGVALARTRLELLGVEAREEANRLASLLLWGVASVLLIIVGTTFLCLFFTVLLWDSHRMLALGISAALFIGAAAIASGISLKLARQGSRLFADSLAELRNDEAALHGERQP